METDKIYYESRQKYYKLYLTLKKSIEKGEYDKSGKLPKEIELAEQFDVSRPTVAKALELLRKKNYIERFSGVGTFVRYNFDKKTKTFAVLLPGCKEDYLGEDVYDAICRRLSELSNTENFNLLWSGSVLQDEDLCRNHLKNLATRYIEQQNIDGVFFSPLETNEESADTNRIISQMFDNAGIPMVLIDKDLDFFPSRSKYDVVGVDNFRIGFIIAKHLIQQGCKTIKFATVRDFAPTVKMRIRGFRQALLECNMNLSKDDVLIVDCKETLDKVLAQGNSLGIICANDFTASKVMHYAEEKGYQIPKDVKVAGIDDIKYSRYLRVPLTTYSQPCKDIADSALELMLDRINHPNKKAVTILIDGELIARKSTAND